MVSKEACKLGFKKDMHSREQRDEKESGRVQETRVAKQ